MNTQKSFLSQSLQIAAKKNEKTITPDFALSNVATYKLQPRFQATEMTFHPSRASSLKPTDKLLESLHSYFMFLFIISFPTISYVFHDRIEEFHLKLFSFVDGGPLANTKVYVLYL